MNTLFVDLRIAIESEMPQDFALVGILWVISGLLLALWVGSGTPLSLLLVLAAVFIGFTIARTELLVRDFLLFRKILDLQTA